MEIKLTTNEAANYLGVSPKTLWEWRNRHPIGLPCYKLGYRRWMYLKSDLDNYLITCRVEKNKEDKNV